MQVPSMQTSGAQHCALVVHAPQVPPTQAWLPQSAHDLHIGVAPSGGGGGGQSLPAERT
jgi:hypothetical protein